MNFLKIYTNIAFFDRFKHKFMPAGDRKYIGLDLYARKTAAAILSGLITIGATYPFELMFTRLTSDMNGPAQKRLYNGTFDCFNQGMLQGGLRSLYSGSLVSLATILPMTLVSLPLYDTFSPMFASLSLNSSPSRSDLILSKIGAGTLAGLFAMLAVYPLDTIKRGMQVIGTRGYPSVDQTFSTTYKSILRAHGFRGLYRGVHIAAIKTFPAVYVQFLIYDYMRSGTSSISYPYQQEEEVKKSIITGEVATA